MRARPMYWLVLALTIGGSVGWRVMVVSAHAHDDWRAAIYRFPADGLPDCADLTGHLTAATRMPGQWSRLIRPDTPSQRPPPSPLLSLQGCRLQRLPAT